MNSQYKQTRPLLQRCRESRLFKRSTVILTLITLVNSLIFPTLLAAKEAFNHYQAKNQLLLSGTISQQLPQALGHIQTLAADYRRQLTQRVNAESSPTNKVLDWLGFDTLAGNGLGDMQEMAAQLLPLHQTAMDEFADTRQHLLDKGLSATIIGRHDDMVTQYQDKYAQMQQMLQPVLEAKSLTRQADAMTQLDGFMQQQKFSKRHQALDPHNLPWSTPDASQTREPLTRAEDLNQLLVVTTKSLNQSSRAVNTAAIDDSSDPAYLAATQDSQINDIIRTLAARLNHDPVEIYNYVRNTISFIPTYGSIQGATHTLQTEQGNAFDTASLLIALLRASDIPARYVYGTVTLPSEQVMNWVGGVNVPEAAQQLLGQGGIPNVGLNSGGQIRNIRLEHVWVEAYVDYFPSRGAKHLSGDSWIPLDASFKQYEYLQPTLDPAKLSYDGQALLESLGTGQVWDATAQSAEVGTALDNLLLAIEEYSDNELGEDELSQMLGEKKTIIQAYDQFGGSLPYQVDARSQAYAEIPDNLRHKIRYQLQTDSGSDVLVHESSLPAFAGQRLSVNFTPASAEDRSALESYLPTGADASLEDLPDNLPGYLIQLQGQINLDGVAAHQGGTFRLGEGVNHKVSLFNPARGWISKEAVGTAGEYRAIGVDLQGMSDAAIEDIQADLEIVQARLEAGESLNSADLMEKLTQLGIYYYLTLNDQGNAEQSKAKNIVEYRLPSFGFFHTTLSPNYYFGVPRSVNFTGVTMDVPYLSGMSYSKDNDADEWVNYNQSKGPRASYLENWVPEQIFNIGEIRREGLSAAKLMDVALSQGQTVYQISAGNLSDLNNVVIDSGGRQDIINSVNAGKVVTVHETPISMTNWRGSGYIVLDPQTGAGGYIISGGANGGFLGLDYATLLSLFSLGIDFIPGIGAVKSLIELITGTDLITGEPVNRWILALAVLAGLVGGAALVKALAKGADKAADAAKTSNQLGKIGEDAVKSKFDIGGKEKIPINGRNRIPDGINDTTLSEVKNYTGKLSYTRQLRDFADIAKDRGLAYDLYVRGPVPPDKATKLSGPLQDAINRGEINLKLIPGTF